MLLLTVPVKALKINKVVETDGQRPKQAFPATGAAGQSAPLQLYCFIQMAATSAVSNRKIEMDFLQRIDL